MVVELAIASVLAIAGVRSLWTWSRRQIEGTDVVDHVLYALFITGRAGMWFSLAGLFVMYASSEAGRLRWYLVVPLALGGTQLLAGWFLGHRAPS